MTIGLFLPNWVGDVVMSTPSIRALRRHFGSAAKLIGIMKPSVAPVLDGSPLLDERWLYDPVASELSLRTPALVWKMWRRQVDIAVLFVNGLRAAQAAWLSRAKVRVGYVRNGRGRFLTTGLQPQVSDGQFIPCSTLDYYLALTYALGCAEESPRMTLATTDAEEAAADRVWKALSLGDQVVTMNASGAFGPAKLWPDEYFGELAARVASERDCQVLFLCGPAERERAARIAKLASHRAVFSLADAPLSIGLSKAVVRRSRLLVSTDSGPRHFAAAFGVPAVVLYGPTHQAWSDTHAPTEIGLQIPVDCGPCQQRTCPYAHHKCMRDLTVDLAHDAVRRQLAAPVRGVFGTAALP